MIKWTTGWISERLVALFTLPWSKSVLQPTWLDVVKLPTTDAMNGHQTECFCLSVEPCVVACRSVTSVNTKLETSSADVVVTGGAKSNGSIRL